MQGNMCRITTLEGKSPPDKKWGIKLQKICQRIYLAIHETSSGYRLIIKVREAGIRLNKARKTHDNAITT